MNPEPRHTWTCATVTAILCTLLAALPATRSAAAGKPKFGPDAVALSRSTDYLRARPAPDYWALSLYYTAQFSNAACSVAAITMLVNGLRGLPPGSEDELFTQQGLLDAVGDARWRAQSVEDGDGVTFEDTVRYIGQALAAAGLAESYEVEVFRPGDDSPQNLDRLRTLLALNERGDGDLILAYFNQGVLTGDWDGPHVSPLGAYDTDTHRVLVMDVDRQWYVPYWSPDEKLLQALLRPAPSDQGVLAGQTGGLFWVRLRSGP